MKLAVALSLVALAGCSSSSSRTGFDQDSTDPADPAPAANPTKLGCASTAYAEPLPTADSLSSISFSSAKAQDYMLAALAKRYPNGKFIFEGGLESSVAQQQGASCWEKFVQDTSSAKAVLRQASTIVHECGHYFDLGAADGNSAHYQITDSVAFTCQNGDTTDRGGKTFARSLIKKDEFYSARPTCGAKISEGCDSYADTYLNGSPTDSTFDSGDQGYSLLLEEATQYVNSLASALAFQDAYANQRASERDGILTFLWYVERYLAYAKTNDPDAYAAITNDACWRQATLTVWDRGWFFIEASRPYDSLGLFDSAIEPLVKEPSLVAQIDALRALECK